MNVFPVTDSTLSAVQLAVFVKEKYAMSGTVMARILKTGISHTYLVTAGSNKYIFRVYSLNWRTEQEIAEEIRLLQLLKAHTIPVSYAIADAQSVYIQQLRAPEGMRYAVLFSFAQGEKQLNFSAALHYKAGEIMANMHRVTNNLSLTRASYSTSMLLTQSLELLGHFLPAATAEMVFMKQLQCHLQQVFRGMDTATVRNGIVHLDIWFDNMVIDEADNITLFDFDFCGNGWLFLDIGYYILQLFSTEKEGNEFELKKEAFLKGYESITPLSAEEKRLLPAAGASLYFFYLGVQCSRYDNWSNVFLNEIYLKRFINLLVKKWADVNQLNNAAG